MFSINLLPGVNLQECRSMSTKREGSGRESEDTIATTTTFCTKNLAYFGRDATSSLTTEIVLKQRRHFFRSPFLWADI